MTELLQEEVMVFVNTIAKIVHGVACEYLGSPNINVGDAFLVVWKIKDSKTGEAVSEQDADAMHVLASLEEGG